MSKIKTDEDGKEYIEFFDNETGDELRLYDLKWEVCNRCNGEGSHTNPNIDGHGISPQEFYDDPEFERDYFAGVYDVPCYECKGKRVTKEINRGTTDTILLKKYEEYLKEKYQYQQEIEYERRMGA